MPNWCHNNLIIEGDAEDLLDFSSRAQRPSASAESSVGEGLSQPLWFSAFVPQPEGNSDFDWWGWRISNWGTKWEPSFAGPAVIAFQVEGCSDEEEVIFDFRMTGDSLEYNFDTAWSPPTPWVQAVSEMYPNLQFSITFGEPGNDYGGVEVYKNGEIIRAAEGGAEEFLHSSQLWF